MPQKILTGVAVVVLLAAAYFLFRGEFQNGASPAVDRLEESSAKPPFPQVVDPEEDEAPEPPSAGPTPEPLAPSETVTLPPLVESDAFVRERLDALGVPHGWTADKDLVRRLAVLLDNATRGELPRRTLRLPKPETRFAVVERDGRLFADPRNAARFDPYLDGLEAVDPSAAARFFETIEPLVDTAFRELGSPESGRAALQEAIAVVLGTSPPPGDLELVRPKVFYEYADPKLESLSPFEKQLLRIGPRNLSRLQTYLKRLDRAVRRSP